MSFSPDERLVVTGTSQETGSGAGASHTGTSSLVLLHAETLLAVKRVTFEANGVVATLWSAKLNQIMVGLSDGQVKVLYSPDKSSRGVTLSVAKAPPRRDPLDDVVYEPEFIRAGAAGVGVGWLGWLGCWGVGVYGVGGRS